MDSLKTLLAQLDPPLKHHVEMRGEDMLLTLVDPLIPAKAERSLQPRQYQNPGLLYVVLLHAINELRGKGSQAPLRVFPITGHDASDRASG
ncbi:hypothetical protein [Pseudomonas massiliensis]|uniref:hypothetical protein n=1 Tax=Pseudomonas massiliensis TaxID=522492 RepID=UPI000590E4B3|nr:hypothetical protein [Pseudomonas massiliensis]